MNRFVQSFTRLWLGPLLIAIASAIALYMALIHDGFIDIAAGVVLSFIGLIGLNLLRSGWKTPNS